MSADETTMADVEAILEDPKSVRFKYLQDRAAYMSITGTYPSHLRVFFTRVLTLISSERPASARPAGSPGSRIVDPDIAARLDLDKHPMVLAVRQHLEDGYQIHLSQGPNERKPYSKIWLIKGADKRTIRSDGSRLDDWA